MGQRSVPARLFYLIEWTGYALGIEFSAKRMQCFNHACQPSETAEENQPESFLVFNFFIISKNFNFLKQ